MAKPSVAEQPATATSTSCDTTDEDRKPKSPPEGKAPSVATGLSGGSLGIGSLVDIRSKVKNDMLEREKNKPALTVDLLRSFWEEYSNQLESKAIQTALTTAVVGLTDTCVVVRVGTQLTKSTILQEAGLLEYIREKTMEDDLFMEVEIDPELAPEESEAKPRSDTEIYEHMRSQNVLLEEFVRILGLKMK